MYANWGINALVVLTTALAVALSVMLHYEGLTQMARRLPSIAGQRHAKVLYGIFGVVILHVVEIWVFGTIAWGLLAIPGVGHVAGADTLGLLDAVYLSAVTFTTVGFGDLAPVGPIRFLCGMEALSGFVLITWSASFTYLEMNRFWRVG
ncbi:MAG: ion transport 2 domain protein [Gammaproteobacteria bacterium HGW-Gammaproteobacteria-5]|jgi:hypothetical protein|nr:MAG: ion transport 2 domain protein [Gammaproteobacteria bacterium HGW-Gammaproteobacteria-5]